MTATLVAHPYADAFPLLPDAELDELVESIRANGLRQPVVVTPDGRILDGRNRAAACARLGIDPETVVYEGDDLAEYVIDSNVTRRNMSTGARAKRLLDEAVGRHPDGIKADELRNEVFGEVRDLLAKVDRDLDAETEALLVSVGTRSRRVRRNGMRRDLAHLLDGFAEDENGVYIDPLLNLAYPIGTEDGMVKTLRSWTSEDFETSTRMAYRKAAEVTAAARDHDGVMTSAVFSMKRRGVSRFGGDA